MMRPSLSDLALVFDLDDTLCLERDFAHSGYAAVGAWLAQSHGIEGFAARCRALLAAGERRAIFDRALAASGLAGAQIPELVPELIARYRAHAPRISLCPDARRCLDRHGPGLALITDGFEATQRAKIAALDLPRWCDLIIPTGQWGADFFKPHPRAFLAVEAARAGRRCVYIGDNAAKDFLTPNRRGWLSIALERPERMHPGPPPGPDHAPQARITSLDQLDEVLARLTGGG